MAANRSNIPKEALKNRKEIWVRHIGKKIYEGKRVALGKLYQKLNTYGEDDFYPYHMPGHKRRLFGEIPGDIMKALLAAFIGVRVNHMTADRC